MSKKSFLLILTILICTFTLGVLVKAIKPKSNFDSQLSSFTMNKLNWYGTRNFMSNDILEVLAPDDYFMADYNKQGLSVNLFFAYFANNRDSRGPHSPENCLPGSGWTIEKLETRIIKADLKQISAKRMYVKRNNIKIVSDYWYITKFGNTSNEYKLKLYMVLSALLFKPNDVAFVRFSVISDSLHIKALGEFENIYIREIYRYLPFD